jgi:hypothetical protein
MHGSRICECSKDLFHEIDVDEKVGLPLPFFLSLFQLKIEFYAERGVLTGLKKVQSSLLDIQL